MSCVILPENDNGENVSFRSDSIFAVRIFYKTYIEITFRSDEIRRFSYNSKNIKDVYKNIVTQWQNSNKTGN